MMSPATLRRWLSGRDPQIPDPLLPHLLQAGAEVSEWDSKGLTSLGVKALSGALDGTGAGRETAFMLLSADAFLTYACEAAAEEGDPGARLEEALARIGRIPS